MDSSLLSVGDVSLQQGLMAEAATRAAATKHARQGVSVDQAAKDFEAMFVAQMLQPMFEGMEVDGMFGGGHGEEVMRGLLVQEYGKSIAASSSFGLSDEIKSEMIRLQAQANSKPTPATSAVGG